MKRRWSQALCLLVALAGGIGMAPAPLRAEPLRAKEAAAAAPSASLRSLFLENLSWLELQAAMEQGVDTVILPIGGVEARGSHLALNASNRLLLALVEQAAREDGHSVIAPVIPFVPEMNDDGEGNLQWVGTLHVSPETLSAVTGEVVTSLKVHGVKRILLLTLSATAADSLRDDAVGLTQLWKEQDVRVGFSEDLASSALYQVYFRHAEISPEVAGDRAGLAETSLLLACCADAVRREAIPRTPQAVRDSGASGRPDLATVAIGKELMTLRVSQIRDALDELRSGKTEN